ncbi:MAG TPA: MGMT family protein [Flavitalea sp.]|nr:MGMT family protein [Flavitalea sp.]
MKTPKKSKQTAREKFTLVQPSGKKDESFFSLVYEVVRQIPRGRVTSYGAIAACLGTKLSARMVGWAMNSAHDPCLKIPAHRVVNRNGLLTGKFHFGEPNEMQRRLEKENIKVENDKIIDFKKVFWDPSEM